MLKTNKMQDNKRKGEPKGQITERDKIPNGLFQRDFFSKGRK